MKKIALTLALVLALAMGANAQNDGFVFDENPFGTGMLRDLVLPIIPGDHGWGSDVPAAPLGSGLLILTALGAGYALKKREEK